MVTFNDWATAKTVCPTGWRLPSDAEWTTLTNNLGGDKVAGKKMKSTSGWRESGNGTNTIGFTALPGGVYVYYFSTFLYIGTSGYWWSATGDDPGLAWVWEIIYAFSYVDRGGNHKANGYSMRCVMD